jgi:hypothetical protein
MQYKLVFVKSHPSHRLAGVGVGGNVMIVLSMISNMTDEDSLFVDMETHECICSEDFFFEGTHNAWEYYFYQPWFNHTRDTKTLTMQETGVVNFSYEDPSFGMDLAALAPWKKRFYNNFALKPALRNFVDAFYEKNIKGKVTLGVQIRLTDMQHHHKTKGLVYSIVKAQEIIKEHPEINQIFLATDDETIILPMQKQFSIPVIYHKGIFRATETQRNNDPDDKLVSDRNLHRYLLGLECLQDIFTLTKCDYLLKADRSAVSIVACVLAENIKKVYGL